MFWTFGNELVERIIVRVRGTGFLVRSEMQKGNETLERKKCTAPVALAERVLNSP